METVDMTYHDCMLCPRLCHANRREGRYGVCGMPAYAMAARAALHMWEEPCISGEKGSGTVFFSGCALRCCYCQNYTIASGDCAKPVTPERLTEIFLRLQQEGAANINLVTATHFLPDIIPALQKAREAGLRIPVVYNSSGYENVETVRMLKDHVDIWLPDLKYMDPDLSARLSGARDYPETAIKAVAQMIEQSGPCIYDGDGYLIKGVIIRHLVLPGHVRNSIAVLDAISEAFGTDITISILSQFTPVRLCPQAPELNRSLTAREYARVLDHALALGFAEGFFQEGEAAKESFIPLFDFEGL